MVAAPHEPTRQVQAVVCVEMREQNIDGARIGVTLKGTEHATAEVDGERRSVRGRYQVPRSRRIWPGDATGTAQYGDSHSH